MHVSMLELVREGWDRGVTTSNEDLIQGNTHTIADEVT